MAEINELQVGVPLDNLLKPTRQATSPVLTPKSPAYHLSLFPSPANSSRAASPQPDTINRPRPRNRAKTAPAGSPLQPTFRKAPIASPHHSPQSSGSILEQDTDTSDSEVEVVTTPEIPRQAIDKEPQWDIVTKPSKQKASATMSPSKVPLPVKQSAPATSTSTLTQTQATTMVGSIAEDAEDHRESAADNEEIPTLIGIAQSVFLSRAKTSKRAKVERVKVSAPAGRSFIPTLVELKDRKARKAQLTQA